MTKQKRYLLATFYQNADFTLTKLKFGEKLKKAYSEIGQVGWGLLVFVLFI